MRERRKKNPGRKPLEWRPVLDGIFYVLRTGCQWKAAPPEFVRGAACTDTFNDWLNRASSPSCGGVGCWSTNSFGGSTGNGKVSTGA